MEEESSVFRENSTSVYVIETKDSAAAAAGNTQPKPATSHASSTILTSAGRSPSLASPIVDIQAVGHAHTAPVTHSLPRGSERSLSGGEGSAGGGVSQKVFPVPPATRASPQSETPGDAQVFQTHSAPLVPGYELDKRRGVATSQPLFNRSQVRVMPTGGSDSDTDDDGASSTARSDGDSRRRKEKEASGGAPSSTMERLGMPLGDGSAATQSHKDGTSGEDEEDERMFIDEFGFVIDEEAKERDDKFVLNVNGRQVVRREIKWANMATDWSRTNLKMHAKLKERCRKGIPSRFRSIAWQLLIDSHQQMEAAQSTEVYLALRDKTLADKDVDAVISRDLARTFPNHVLFQDEGGVGQTFLKNVLHAYAGSDPEVGYVQGMAFIVGALSTQMGEEESFWALHDMMYSDRYKMRELFKPGFPLLQQFFYQFKRLLARILPKLSKRFNELNVEPSFYASQWFLTLFVYHFPFRALLRVWDVFFCEGWKIIFRTGLALLQWEEKRLLSLSFEELLPALKSLQDGKDARQLLRHAHRIKFKTADLNRYGDEYWHTVGGGADAGMAVGADPSGKNRKKAKR